MSEVLIATTYDTCCIGHRFVNLVTRVPGLFGQWVSVQGDSEIVDAISQKTLCLVLLHMLEI